MIFGQASSEAVRQIHQAVGKVLRPIERLLDRRIGVREGGDENVPIDLERQMLTPNLQPPTPNCPFLGVGRWELGIDRVNISNAVTTVVLVPAFLLGAHHLRVRRPRALSPRRVLEAILLGACTVALGLFVFETNGHHVWPVEFDGAEHDCGPDPVRTIR